MSWSNSLVSVHSDEVYSETYGDLKDLCFV